MNNKQYWAVGANFGADDMAKKFLNHGEWYDGNGPGQENRNMPQLERVKVGDILLMKSSSTKGPNRETSFTKLKGIGRVTAKPASHHFSVNWFSIPNLPRDFDGISYRKTIEPLRQDALLSFAEKVLMQETQNALLDLLKARHQIILQGPPGTGKTYLAKQLAEALVEPKHLGQRSSIFDDFELYWQGRDAELAEQQALHRGLLQGFHEEFPIDQLNKLTLEEYAVGTGSNDSFCWWIERGLKPLGSYSPGSSRTYLIYWSKDKQEYSLHGDLVKSAETPEEAMEKLSSKLHELVTQRGKGEIEQWLGDSFALKILHSYHPDLFFPINGANHLNGALTLLEMDPKQYKNRLDKNLALQAKFQEEKERRGFQMGSIDFMRYLSDNYDLKGDIEISREGEVMSKGKYQLVQFHPAYSYEDFVRGITAELDAEGNITYLVKNRVVAEMARQAADSPNANFILLIDEINRANLPAVLGELIYALEYRGEPVESLYEHPEDGRAITLPPNLYLIGTMNTADRSVGHIDYAIRRRFAFVDMLPDPDVIQEPHGKQLFETVAKIFQNHLASDFSMGDVQLGHSYFMAESLEELPSRLEYEIKPILKEYLRDGVLKPSAKNLIDKLAVNG